MITYWQTIILAFVEALTEFLPISSTAHLILTAKLLNLESTNFLATFEIVIQLGAILAVLVVFGQRLWRNRRLWPKIIWAFIPTAIIGFTVYPLVKNYLLEGTPLTGWMLIIGGIIMAIWDIYDDKKALQKADQQNSPLTPQTAGCLIESASDQKIDQQLTTLKIPAVIIIGICQSFATVPGVSRSLITTLGGMATGLSKKAAVEFSFLLAIPTVAAASGLDLVKGLYNQFAIPNGEILFASEQEVLLLILGTLVAFVTALFLTKFMVKIMSAKNSFVYFGIYRIIIGCWWLLIF